MCIYNPVEHIRWSFFAKLVACSPLLFLQKSSIVDIRLSSEYASAWEGCLFVLFCFENDFIFLCLYFRGTLFDPRAAPYCCHYTNRTMSQVKNSFYSYQNRIKVSYLTKKWIMVYSNKMKNRIRRMFLSPCFNVFFSLFCSLFLIIIL